MSSLLLALLGIVLVACAPEPSGPAADTDDTAVSADTSSDTVPDSAADSGHDTDEPAPDTTCSELATRSCACDDSAAVGSQRCLADSSGWGACTCTTYGASLYVDPHAAPGGDGSLGAPLSTLDDALLAVQQAVTAGLPDGGLVVWLAGGTYARTTRFALSTSTSGRSGAPVVWKGLPGEVATISGAVVVDPSAFVPLTEDSSAYARVDVAARPHVRVADLSALGLTDPGTLRRRGFCTNPTSSAAELFVNGTPLRLARWPDATSDTSAEPDAAVPINHGFAGIVADVDGRSFTYAGDRPSRWASAPDAWLHGFWKYAWADCHVPLAGVDAANARILLGDSPGYGIAAGQPYYAYNLLEELTEPGEWYLDRTTGLLYVWPPEGFDSARVELSVLEDPVVLVYGAHDVVLEDLTIEGGRGEALRIDSGVDVRVRGVRLRNTGGYGAKVTGRNVALEGLLVYGTGGGGVSLSGGDRVTLTRGDLSITDSALHDFARWEWTYRPGVYATGVGQTVMNNEIWQAPHAAILFSGNDHTFARNDIHDVLRFSSDAGAIYAGRDWGARGNVIAQNFVHDLATVFPGYGVHGIYLDDCLSGITVSGNLLYNITGNALQHGGGRDDHMTGNLVARAGVGLATDARCANWANVPDPTPGSSWNLLEKLENVHYQEEPWASRWPECAVIPNDYDAIFDPAASWRLPEGTTFTANVGWDNGVWIRESHGATVSFADTSNNLVLDRSPFVDEAGGDLHLDPAGSAFDVPGFVDFPLDEVGVVR